jgi:hypothetical protein
MPIAILATLAGCTQKKAEDAEAPDAGAPPAGETVAEESTAANETSYPQPDLPVADDTILCVIDVPADAICTMDLNQCGHSSTCNCGPGYSYNASMGKCLLVLAEGVVGARVDLADDQCAKAPAGVCTRDINQCGHPSSCQCDEGFAWNDIAGKCLKA